MKTIYKVIIILIISTFLVTLVSYLIFWGSFKVSNDQLDWTFFSTYFSNISAPIFLVITIIFSLLVSTDNYKQTIIMRNIDDLRRVIQLQSEEIEKQYDRNIFTNWPNGNFREIKIRDTLSIPKYQQTKIIFSLDFNGVIVIDYGIYLKGIIHNLKNLSMLLEKLDKSYEENTYITKYYKRKFSFDLEQIMDKNTLPVYYIKKDNKLNDIAKELLNYYKHDLWD